MFENVDFSDDTDSDPDYVPEFESEEEDEPGPSTSKNNEVICQLQSNRLLLKGHIKS